MRCNSNTEITTLSENKLGNVVQKQKGKSGTLQGLDLQRASDNEQWEVDWTIAVGHSGGLKTMIVMSCNNKHRNWRLLDSLSSSDVGNEK